jgi:hypothetical protein
MIIPDPDYFHLESRPDPTKIVYLSKLINNSKIFNQKIVTKLTKIVVGDPVSGKTYPGSRGQKAPYPGSDPQ